MVKNYKNSFGELHADAITLIVNEQKQTIRLKNLVRIRFVKRQKYHINGIAFLLCFYLLLLLRNPTLSQAFQSLIFSVTMILLEIGIFFKSFDEQIKSLQSGKSDIIFSLGESESRKKFGYFLCNSAGIGM